MGVVSFTINKKNEILSENRTQKSPKMQTLRKKTSPLKFKNETTRFLGDGVSFKAKLIGILEVSEARGDRMCQEALCDLKMAIRAAGEHKQRITINIALDGLRLRDEKTGDCLYHHPVHKISFIAQDMTDSRAFGYIFGSPDTGHRFFGIKTDKAASQVVIAMRDLFQVVFTLKKKEIELAKQHLEKNYLTTSPLFSDSSTSTSAVKVKLNEKLKNDTKTSSTESKNSASGTAVADLVDLELELNSLQQGLTQMERITPSDPFGDSFISYPINKLILPPPPSGKDRHNRSVVENKTPPNNVSSSVASEFTFSSRELSTSHEDEISSSDWFNPTSFNQLFEDLGPLSGGGDDNSKHEAVKLEILSQFDVFTDLDPLDPFGEDPFGHEDPFANADFTKLDPFENADKKLRCSPKMVQFDAPPDPPPRPQIIGDLPPPPLPPKKLNEIVLKQTPSSVPKPSVKIIQSDFIIGKIVKNNEILSPPLPLPQRRMRKIASTTKTKGLVEEEENDYLTPITLESMKSEENFDLEGLDITLSQLTLSGLNELAGKLKIPPNKLSNMTLVQLTQYLSTFIKTQEQPKVENTIGTTFQVDFAANFDNNDKNSTTNFDKYAVFRELQLAEKVKQINPEEVSTEDEPPPPPPPPPPPFPAASVSAAAAAIKKICEDRYAALREIVENTKIEQSIIPVQDEMPKNEETPQKKQAAAPIPQNRLNSGSLSDVLSVDEEEDGANSSPEVETTTNNSDIINITNKKPKLVESWAIFNQQEPEIVPLAISIAALPVSEEEEEEEEGVLSPSWSSDSKETTHNWDTNKKIKSERRKKAPSEGRARISSREFQPGYYQPTDSYEEDFYDCYDDHHHHHHHQQQPRSRIRLTNRKQQKRWHSNCGHSSSSRDVSPSWEEEEEEFRSSNNSSKRWIARNNSRGRHRTSSRDSWDEEEEEEEEEEEDEYDEEKRRKRGYIQDGWDEYSHQERPRYSARRRISSKEKWCCSGGGGATAADWDNSSPSPSVVVEKIGGGRFRSNRKLNQRINNNSRDSQTTAAAESPWEDEIVQNSTKNKAPLNWRPSSASEIERKSSSTSEMQKSRHFLLGANNSDEGGGERNKSRNVMNRRSRSRDSSSHSHHHHHQLLFTENRHKIETANLRLNKRDIVVEPNNKKIAFISRNSKKIADSSTSSGNSSLTLRRSVENEDIIKMNHHHNKRKFIFNSSRLVDDKDKNIRKLDQNHHSEDVQLKIRSSSSSSSVVVKKPPHSPFEDDFSPGIVDDESAVPNTMNNDNSIIGISSIKEEEAVPEDEEDSSFIIIAPNNLVTDNNKKVLLKKSSRIYHQHKKVNLKKSGSVNIFSRENDDPFDDDFFSSGGGGMNEDDEEFDEDDNNKVTELKTNLNNDIRSWTEEFDDNYDSFRKS